MHNLSLRVILLNSLLCTISFAEPDTSNDNQSEVNVAPANMYYYGLSRSQTLTRQIPGDEFESIAFFTDSGEACKIIREKPLKESTLFSDEAQLGVYNNLSKKIENLQNSLNDNQIESGLFNYVFGSNYDFHDEFEFLAQNIYASTDRNVSIRSFDSNQYGTSLLDLQKDEFQLARKTYASIMQNYNGPHVKSLLYEADSLPKVFAKFTDISEIIADGLVEVRKLVDSEEETRFGSFNTLIIHYKDSSRKPNEIVKYILTSTPTKNSNVQQNQSNNYDHVESKVVHLNPVNQEIMAIATFSEDDDISFVKKYNNVETKKINKRFRCLNQINLLKTEFDPELPTLEKKFLVTFDNDYPSENEINSWVEKNCQYETNSYDFDYQQKLEFLPVSMEYFVYSRNNNPSPTSNKQELYIEKHSSFSLFFNLEKGRILNSYGFYTQELLPNSKSNLYRNKYELRYMGDSRSNFIDKITYADLNSLRLIFNFINKIDFRKQELSAIIEKIFYPFSFLNPKELNNERIVGDILKRPNFLTTKILQRILLTEDEFLYELTKNPPNQQIFVTEEIEVNYEVPHNILGSNLILQTISIDEEGVTSNYSDVNDYFMPPAPQVPENCVED
jgi:hypothetical protein